MIDEHSSVRGSEIVFLGIEFDERSSIIQGINSSFMQCSKHFL